MLPILLSAVKSMAKSKAKKAVTKKAMDSLSSSSQSPDGGSNHSSGSLFGNSPQTAASNSSMGPVLSSKEVEQLNKESRAELNKSKGGFLKNLFGGGNKSPKKSKKLPPIELPTPSESTKKLEDIFSKYGIDQEGEVGTTTKEVTPDIKTSTAKTASVSVDSAVSKFNIKDMQIKRSKSEEDEKTSKLQTSINTLTEALYTSVDESEKRRILEKLTMANAADHDVKVKSEGDKLKETIVADQKKRSREKTTREKEEILSTFMTHRKDMGALSMGITDMFGRLDSRFDDKKEHEKKALEHETLGSAIGGSLMKFLPDLMADITEKREIKKSQLLEKKLAQSGDLSEEKARRLEKRRQDLKARRAERDERRAARKAKIQERLDKLKKASASSDEVFWVMFIGWVFMKLFDQIKLYLWDPIKKFFTDIGNMFDKVVLFFKDINLTFKEFGLTLLEGLNGILGIDLDDKVAQQKQIIQELTGGREETATQIADYESGKAEEKKAKEDEREEKAKANNPMYKSLREGDGTKGDDVFIKQITEDFKSGKMGAEDYHEQTRKIGKARFEEVLGKKEHKEMSRKVLQDFKDHNTDSIEGYIMPLNMADADGGSIESTSAISTPKVAKIPEVMAKDSDSSNEGMTSDMVPMNVEPMIKVTDIKSDKVIDEDDKSSSDKEKMGGSTPVILPQIQDNKIITTNHITQVEQPQSYKENSQ